MVKRFGLSLFLGVAIAALCSAAALAAPPDLTGTWSVQQTGVNGTTQTNVVIKQSGNSLVGQNSADKHAFIGTFVSDAKIDGTWHGPSGAGWVTVYVTPNGHSFNGTWGYHGRAANGSFVANKILPPSPITTAGTWNVTGAGGSNAFVGKMTCTQSGPTAICHAGTATIHGKFRATDKVRGTWNSQNGSGWVSFWFNEDNNSFNGIWGYGTDMSKPAGRIVGQRAL